MQHAGDPPLAREITHRLVDRPEFAGLFLSGSFGRGDADAYSDVDFLALAASDQHGEVAALWRQTLQTLRPIVFWNQQRGRARSTIRSHP
jgi:predicted nucleotidyltransferase